MKASPEIYHLIRSLTKAEKRYFKLYASLQSGNKNYLLLFDAIDKQAKRKGEQEEYDENEVMNELEGEDFIKHLPVIKNYLYNLILKSIRSYRTDDSLEKYLRGAIQDIHFLHEKGLHDQARKFLKKAKDTAQENEKFLLLIELLSLEHDINLELLDLNSIGDKSGESFQQIHDALNKLENLYGYKKLEADLTLTNKNKLWSNESEDIQTYENIIGHELLQDENQALSQEAYLLYYLLHIVTLVYSEQDMDQSTIEKVYQYNSKLLKLFDEHHQLAEDYAQRYIAVLRNQILAAQKLGKEEEIWESVDKLKGFPVKNRKNKNRALATAYMQEMYIHVLRGKFEKGYKLLSEMTEQLPKIRPYINKDHELSNYFNGFQITFALERYDEALEWLKAITQDEEYTETREDLRSFARVLETIVYFEMDESDQALRCLRQLHRYFTRKGQLNEFEYLFIEFIKSLTRTDTLEELDVLFRMMKDKLENMETESDASRVFQYFDLHAWLTSKLENKSFATIILEKANPNFNGGVDQKSAAEN